MKARSIVAERLGAKVCELRLLLNLGQKQLADVAGTSTKVISQLERGVSVPSVEKLAEIASALDAELVDLFDFEETISDRRHRALIQIDYMLRGRTGADLEDVRDMLKLVFEIKRRERPDRLRTMRQSRQSSP